MVEKGEFDKLSLKISELTTRNYSTSFSLGIKMLSKKFHNPIYSIYGFVRFADEIVDGFHDYNKSKLLNALQSKLEDGESSVRHAAISELGNLGSDARPVGKSLFARFETTTIDLGII